MARPAPEIPILLSEQRCYFQNVEIFGANFNELVIGRPGARRPVIKAAYASRGALGRAIHQRVRVIMVLVAKGRPYRELNLILKQAIKGGP